MSSSGANVWFEEGWQQVRAGVTLIDWSRLASWCEQGLALVATEEAEFESPAGHREVHRELGRLICWIVFSAGAEYLAKGTCLLHGCDLLGKPATVYQPPSCCTSVAQWIKLMNVDKGNPLKYEDSSFGTLGSLLPHLRKILKAGQERDLVLASFKYLASTIRNRDAHRYVRNVRMFDFQAVGILFVPAFNILLRSLDQAELRVRLSGLVMR
jgi:hypothetical protein